MFILESSDDDSDNEKPQKIHKRGKDEIFGESDKNNNKNENQPLKM